MKGSEDVGGLVTGSGGGGWWLKIRHHLASPYIRLQKLRYDQPCPWELYTGTLDRFLMSDACISGHHPNTHIRVAPRSGEEELAGMRSNEISSIRERSGPDHVTYNVGTATAYAESRLKPSKEL